jgi:AcrR family transcriptional regulator
MARVEQAATTGKAAVTTTSRSRTLARRAAHATGSADAIGLDRRAGILRIAARRFAEFGFEQTTTREIAADANILSGSIYHHFDTKDEMLDEIIRDAVIATRDRMLRLSAADCDAELKLVALILLSMRELISDQETQAILYNERRLFRRRPEFAYVADAKAVAFRAWQRVLDNGTTAGLFKPGLDPFLTITTIVRMLNTCADWFRHDRYGLEEPQNVDFAEVVKFNLGFILAAIRDPSRITAPIPHAAGERMVDELIADRA